MIQPEEIKMLHRMTAYCSMAERCIHDVEKKMLSAGLSAKASERILAFLKEENFIDEKRFARCFVNDKLRFNKWGRKKIAYELNKKKIPPDVCREALDSIDRYVYSTTLLAILKEKKKTIHRKDERDTFNQLFRFAAGRGFESRETLDCLRRLFEGSDYVDDPE